MDGSIPISNPDSQFSFKCEAICETMAKSVSRRGCESIRVLGDSNDNRQGEVIK